MDYSGSGSGWMDWWSGSGSGGWVDGSGCWWGSCSHEDSDETSLGDWWPFGGRDSDSDSSSGESSELMMYQIGCGIGLSVAVLLLIILVVRKLRLNSHHPIS